jgi:hypothetical protein
MPASLRYDKQSLDEARKEWWAEQTTIDRLRRAITFTIKAPLLCTPQKTNPRSSNQRRPVEQSSPGSVHPDNKQLHEGGEWHKRVLPGAPKGHAIASKAKLSCRLGGYLGASLIRYRASQNPLPGKAIPVACA